MAEWKMRDEDAEALASLTMDEEPKVTRQMMRAGIEALANSDMRDALYQTSDTVLAETVTEVFQAMMRAREASSR